MALLVPNDGAEIAIGCFVNKTTPENPKLDIYNNDRTPAEGDTAASYTAATGGGYPGSQTLTGSSWTISADVDPAEASYAQQTFTWTSVPGTPSMYGYFVRTVTGGILMWAERFASPPYTIANANDQIKVTPKITAD